MDERQKRFADYYIELGIAEQAALKAGYSEKYARGQSYKLLANVGIKKYIDDRISEKDSQRIAKQDEVLEFLTNVLRGKEQEQFPIGLGMGEQKLVNKKLDGKDRIKAAELLGKRYAMWTDKQQVDGLIPVTIVNDLDD